VKLEFNIDMIKKSGSITVHYNENGDPTISMSDWTISGKRKWWQIFRKRRGRCGVSISGGSVVISGEVEEKSYIEVAEIGSKIREIIKKDNG